MKTIALYFSKALSQLCGEEVHTTHGTGEPTRVVVDKNDYDKLAEELEKSKKDNACLTMKLFTTK